MGTAGIYWEISRWVLLGIWGLKAVSTVVEKYFYILNISLPTQYSVIRVCYFCFYHILFLRSTLANKIRFYVHNHNNSLDTFKLYSSTNSNLFVTM